MFDPEYPLVARMMNYNALFGEKYPGSNLMLSNGILHGVWILGNNYKGSGFYGAYPPGYMRRISVLFPDTPFNVLHLFSGSLPKSKEYVRFDMKQKADVKGNAEHVSDFFKAGQFDVSFADPPYSKAAAVKYGVPMPNRRLVLNSTATVLRPGGFVVWLDTVWPMVAKKTLQLVGTIAILRSSNHVVRTAFIFRKPRA